MMYFLVLALGIIVGVKAGGMRAEGASWKEVADGIVKAAVRVVVSVKDYITGIVGRC